jgi:hypothetical protein
VAGCRGGIVFVTRQRRRICGAERRCNICNKVKKKEWWGGEEE